MKPPLHVLLIEDEADAAALVRQTFADGSRPVTVTVLGDGDQALAYLEQRPPHTGATRPDLALLDLDRGSVSGLALLARLKQQESLRSIPVVVLAGTAAPADVVASYELGGSCYIQKPDHPDALKDVLRVVRDFWLTTVKLP